MCIFLFGGDEDDWIKNSQGVWIKHGNPSSTPDEVLKQQDAIARAIQLYNQKKSDATLLITNSSYKPKLKVHFKHVFPQYVSGINFAVNAPSSTEAIATVKFAHTGYTIERLESP